jgi:hypothetical protein
MNDDHPHGDSGSHDTDSAPHKCPHCDFESHTERGLHVHMGHRHPDESVASVEPATPATPAAVPPATYPMPEEQIEADDATTPLEPTSAPDSVEAGEEAGLPDTPTPGVDMGRGPDHAVVMVFGPNAIRRVPPGYVTTGEHDYDLACDLEEARIQLVAYALRDAFNITAADAEAFLASQIMPAIEAGERVGEARIRMEVTT